MLLVIPFFQLLLNLRQTLSEIGIRIYRFLAFSHGWACSVLFFLCFYTGEAVGKVVWMISESYAFYRTRTRMTSLRMVEKYKDGLEGTGAKSTKRTKNYDKDLV
jgi:hypothetical protein